MKSNKVLVTGGAGYIGSHTVVELLNPGKAKRELGWKSQTPLSETLKNSWAWQKNISSIK